MPATFSISESEPPVCGRFQAAALAEDSALLPQPYSVLIVSLPRTSHDLLSRSIEV